MSRGVLEKGKHESDENRYRVEISQPWCEKQLSAYKTECVSRRLEIDPGGFETTFRGKKVPLRDREAKKNFSRITSTRFHE